MTADCIKLFCKRSNANVHLLGYAGSHTHRHRQVHTASKYIHTIQTNRTPTSPLTYTNKHLTQATRTNKHIDRTTHTKTRKPNQTHTHFNLTNPTTPTENKLNDNNPTHKPPPKTQTPNHKQTNTPYWPRPPASIPGAPLRYERSTPGAQRVMTLKTRIPFSSSPQRHDVLSGADA